MFHQWLQVVRLKGTLKTNFLKWLAVFFKKILKILNFEWPLRARMKEESLWRLLLNSTRRGLSKFCEIIEKFSACNNRKSVLSLSMKLLRNFLIESSCRMKLVLSKAPKFWFRVVSMQLEMPSHRLVPTPCQQLSSLEPVWSSLSEQELFNQIGSIVC